VNEGWHTAKPAFLYITSKPAFENAAIIANEKAK
jgi:hypothetical protein